MDKPKFGQFLINNDVIDEAVLFEALLLQEKQQESTARLAIANNYMTVKQVMSVFNEQPDTCVSFLDMAITLDYVNTDQANTLKLLQQQSRPRLGEILVQLGVLDSFVLEDMLEKFSMLSVDIAFKDISSNALKNL